MKKKRQLISIIVRAYRQEKTIKKDLENIEKTLSGGIGDYDYEIICVVDGKLDKTWGEAERTASKKIKVLGYEINKGKGYAVRFGFAHSKGDLVSFLDAGMDI